jgi:DNA modification methylase
MLELNKIYNMDALNGLRAMSDESVDCIITSPPYFQLRDYGVDGQIGLESTPQEFVAKLVEIFHEAKRALKKMGTLWIVIGDTYNGTSAGKKTSNKESYHDYSFRENIGSIARKSLLMIPARLAIAMIDDGWTLRNKIIWHKPNAMPSSVNDRFTVDYEEVLFFTKAKQYYFKQLKEPMITKDLYEANKGVDLVNQFNRQGLVRGSVGAFGQPQSGSRKQDQIGRNDYTGFNARYQTPEDLQRNKRTVWTIPTSQSAIDHFAMFPEALIEPMIESGCPKDGIVLDMFSGSGTTCAVAKRMGRSYIGFDINGEYTDIANKRVAKEFYQSTLEDFGGDEECSV